MSKFNDGKLKILETIEQVSTTEKQGSANIEKLELALRILSTIMANKLQ